MRLTLKSFLVVCSLSLFLTSCDKNEGNVNNTPSAGNVKARLAQVAKSVTQGNTSTPSTSDEDFASECIATFDCFEFVFPLTLTDANGDEKTVNNDEELADFYESLPQDFYAEFNYPITIRLADGTEQVLANEEALNEAYDICFGEEQCFTFNFPITVSAEGTETVVNSETELQNFYDNLSFDAVPEFVFPFTITLSADDREVTVNNDNEFDAIYGECYGFDDFDDHEGFDCFEVQFPITASSAANGEVTLNSEEDLIAYFYSLGEDETPAINFPITILYEDGTNREIDSFEALETAFDDCFMGADDSGICFDITYPINLQKNEETTTITVNNDAEFNAFLDTLEEDDFFDIAYPLTVLLEDGSTRVINNDEEFIDLAESCDGRDS